MPDTALADARAALDHHGLSWRSLDPLSPPRAGKKQGRHAFLAVLADGTRLKVRCLETSEDAARLESLRRHPVGGFAPILARHDAALLEVWIDGDQLSADAAARRSDDVGALLGRLHAAGAAVAGPPQPAASRRERAEADLGRLVGSSALSASQSERLLGVLVDHDPRASAQTLVHLDYCPENLVVDTAGALHAVDNEWLRIDAPGVDLGRTCARWPMDGATWARFIEGYRRTAPLAPEALAFWLVAMAAASAIVRLPERSHALSILEQMSDGVCEYV